MAQLRQDYKFDKDAIFERIESLCINAGNCIIDNNGNIGIGIDAFTKSSNYITKKISTLTTGKKNIAIGYQTGNIITTGNNNIILGSESNPDSASSVNQIVIGKGVTGHGNNISVIGNTDCIAWHPADDNGVDLGSTTYSFKDAYIQGVVYASTLNNGFNLVLPTTDGVNNQVLYLKHLADVHNIASLTWRNNGNSVSELNDLSDCLVDNTTIIIDTSPSSTIDGAERNTSIGHRSLRILSTGNDNTSMGFYTLSNLTSQDDNISLGSGSNPNMTGVNKLVTIGAQANNKLNVVNSSDAEGTISIGYCSNLNLECGQFNTALGYQALRKIICEDKNTAVGYGALTNLTGTNNDSNNTVMGSQSAENLISGQYNTIIGNKAALNAKTIKKNVIIGSNACNLYESIDELSAELSAETGAIAIGYKAQYSIGNGINNITIGDESGVNIQDGNSNVAIGDSTCGSYYLYTNIDTSYNVAIGQSSLFSINTSSGENISIGSGSGMSLTSGNRNIFIGSECARRSLSVCETVIIGYYAGSSSHMTSDANHTISIGHKSGYSLTSGKFNTAIGYNTLYTNSIGDNNTAIGYETLYNFNAENDGEGNNTIMGYKAGRALSIGKNNVFIGESSGLSVTSGLDNTFIGSIAGENVLSGNNNTFIGLQCGQCDDENKLTGGSNTAIGHQTAFKMKTSASYNTCIGTATGQNITTGENNILIGESLGSTLTTGNNNILIGNFSNIDSSSGDSRIIIGHSVTGTADNTVYIGKSGSKIECEYITTGTWSGPSDIRQKKDIKEDTLGLSFINDLRPVTYKHKSPSEFPEEWDAYDSTDTEPLGGDKIIHGLIAQEVKSSLDKFNVNTFNGWSVDPDGRQRIGLSAFILPLIKVVQELSKQVEKLKIKVRDLSS